MNAHQRPGSQAHVEILKRRLDQAVTLLGEKDEIISVLGSKMDSLTLKLRWARYSWAATGAALVVCLTKVVGLW